MQQKKRERRKKIIAYSFLISHLRVCLLTLLKNLPVLFIRITFTFYTLLTAQAHRDDDYDFSKAA